MLTLFPPLLLRGVSARSSGQAHLRPGAGGGTGVMGPLKYSGSCGGRGVMLKLEDPPLLLVLGEGSIRPRQKAVVELLELLHASERAVPLRDGGRSALASAGRCVASWWPITPRWQVNT